MNRFLMLVALGAVALSGAISCEQDVKSAPSSVETAFQAKYPGASMVEWEKQLGNYLVEFFFGSHEMEAQFDKEGNWLWSKTEISLSEVPEKVLEVARNYNDGKWAIDDIDYYQRSSGVTEYYRVEYERENSDRERVLYVQPDGVTFKL